MLPPLYAFRRRRDERSDGRFRQIRHAATPFSLRHADATIHCHVIIFAAARALTMAFVIFII